MGTIQLLTSSGLLAVGLALGLALTIGTGDAAEDPRTVANHAGIPVIEVVQPGVVIAGLQTPIAVPQPGIRLSEARPATVAAARSTEEWTALAFAAVYDECAAAALQEAMAAQT